MTIEITEKTDAPEKKADVEDIKDTLKQADEYEKKRIEVEKLEALYAREQEIKAKLAYGGNAVAGKAEESQEDKDEKEAASNLQAYQ